MWRPIPILAILLCHTATAQIPNGGFEDWMDQEGYLDPVGWLTYNDVPTVGGPTVAPGAPGQPGNVHVVITSRAAQGGGLPIQGWISAGTSGTHAGFPSTARPALLTGQWQYAIQPTDSGQVLVALSKWNSFTASTEMIALGTLEVTGSLANWQSFQVPLTYFSSDTPDTAYIQIVSSIDFSAPIVGSYMKVDDLAFSGTVGLAEDRLSAQPSVHPNPGSDHFTTSALQGTHLIRVFDATGREVLRQHIQGGTTVVSTTLLPSGLYMVQVDDGPPVRWVKE